MQRPRTPSAWPLAASGLLFILGSPPPRGEPRAGPRTSGPTAAASPASS